jgi:hypothetical protein
MTNSDFSSDLHFDYRISIRDLGEAFSTLKGSVKSSWYISENKKTCVNLKNIVDMTVQEAYPGKPEYKINLLHKKGIYSSLYFDSKYIAMNEMEQLFNYMINL